MKDREKTILKILRAEYGETPPGLVYEDPFQLLIAVILSAQCTDIRVNKVTEVLFAKYNSPETFLTLSAGELEAIIRECGLFRNKAKNILRTCAILVDNFSGEVPKTREELMTLPGVGRKSANVVLSQAFGKAALAVDTHVFRVSRRLGLASGKNPLVTERELQEIIPERCWSQAHLWLIHHGRKICRAQNPRCWQCPLREYCPSGGKVKGEKA